MLTTIATALGLSQRIVKVGLIALVIASIGLGIYLYGKGQDRLVETAKDAGAAKVTADNLEETIKRVEKANEARTEIRDGVGDARYNQCLRTARTPANCQRFMPERPAD